MSHILGKLEDRAVSRGWEDLESCVIFTVGVVLSLPTFHTGWFDPTAAGEWVSSGQTSVSYHSLDLFQNLAKTFC